MQLQFQTSTSEMIPIRDFHYLYELARCSKCQSFVVLKKTNKMYGASDDCSCIHEIFIPFEVSTDLYFRMEPENKDMVSKYKEYFIPDQFPYVIVPDYYWEMYKAGDIESMFIPDYNQYILLDRTTGQMIDQIQMSRTIENLDYMRMNMLSQIEGMLNRFNTLEPVTTFTNMEKNESVRRVYDNKTSIGSVFLKLQVGNRMAIMSIYKGMYSLAKADSLDIDIQFDRFQSNLFMATFRPKKKKNPMNLDTYGMPFYEVIRCMYINVA